MEEKDLKPYYGHDDIILDLLFIYIYIYIYCVTNAVAVMKATFE